MKRTRNIRLKKRDHMEDTKQKKIYPVDTIIDWFLASNRLLIEDEGAEQMTPPRLMSLLYYAQAASMAVRGVPMYDEPVMAWKFGPVVEKVYDKYKKYGSGSIPYDKAPEPDAIAPDDRSLLEEMYINFGIYSAWGLRTLIRTETAWKDTPAGEEVPREMMREYFTRNYLS